MAETVRCIRCDVDLQNLSSKDFHPVDGLAFATCGHYGSTYFDPMDGTWLQVVVCDECIEVAEANGLGFRSSLACPPLPDPLK